MKKTLSCVIILMVVLFLPACTTASYKNKFQKTEIPDQYKFKVYVGGFQFSAPLESAKVRIHEYMTHHGFSDYEIIDRRYTPVPSAYEFTVQFIKENRIKNR